MASKPAATKRSSSLNEVASSMVQPNTLPPNITGAISSPEFPSRRFCIPAASTIELIAAHHPRVVGRATAY
jgi:hypothetical protein